MGVAEHEEPIWMNVCVVWQTEKRRAVLQVNSKEFHWPRQMSLCKGKHFFSDSRKFAGEKYSSRENFRIADQEEASIRSAREMNCTKPRECKQTRTRFFSQCVSRWSKQLSSSWRVFHGMSSTDIRDENYTFEIKFGTYHQKVTITMNPFSLTMNTLREVAVRFIETMVRTSCKLIDKLTHLASFSLVSGSEY